MVNEFDDDRVDLRGRGRYITPYHLFVFPSREDALLGGCVYRKCLAVVRSFQLLRQPLALSVGNSAQTMPEYRGRALPVCPKANDSKRTEELMPRTLCVCCICIGTKMAGTSSCNEHPLTPTRMNMCNSYRLLSMDHPYKGNFPHKGIGLDHKLSRVCARSR